MTTSGSKLNQWAQWSRYSKKPTTNFSNKVYFASEQQTGTFKAVYG